MPDQETNTEPDNLPLKVRHAFYEGLSRECLDQAWRKLADFRDQKRMTRMFRGKQRERQGIPLNEIATSLSRSTGELSRWFQGQSPSWANLALVMTALSAEWPDLQKLPEKQRRRIAGCIAAIRVIHRTHFGESSPANPPTSSAIRCLIALSDDESWIKARRLPSRREQVFRRVADANGIRLEELEVADRDCGDSFVWWLNYFANSLDEQIWQ